MSDPSKAVVLSYAFQDAEALRPAGDEVWFDPGGEEGRLDPASRQA